MVDDMAKDTNDFFFAVTAINVAFLMKKYFHLAEHLKPGVDVNEYSNRRTLKNFCGMLVKDRNAYFELHRLFLSYFYDRIWQRGKKKTLLDFNESFQ